MARGSSKKKKASSDLTSSILNKWRAQSKFGFIRFVDGDTGNCAVSNLRPVSMQEAMDHVHDWKVDWDMNLTQEERALVLDDAWRAGLILNSE